MGAMSRTSAASDIVGAALIVAEELSAEDAACCAHPAKNTMAMHSAVAQIVFFKIVHRPFIERIKHCCVLRFGTRGFYVQEGITALA
jgi:hypothetical protein